jgi:hypothetical protein
VKGKTVPGEPAYQKPTPRRDRQRAGLLVLLLFAVYLLVYRGTFKNPADEWFMYALADSMSRNAALDVDQMAYVGEFKGLARFGADGHLYSKYSVVESALAVPLLWAGRALPEVGQAPLALFVNPLLTAATAALLFATARRLGYAAGPALGVGLSFGLATTAFVYAKTFTSEPSTALVLALALYGVVGAGGRPAKSPSVFGTGTGDESPRPGGRDARGPGRAGSPATLGRPAFGFAAIAGAALGMVFLSKEANAVAIPGFVLGLAMLRRGRSNRRTWLAFAVPLAVGVALALAYNVARFGDPFQTGYTPADGGFTANPVVSLPALLISPGRGILAYSPILIVALVATPAFARRHFVPALTLLVAGIPLALLYALWHGWHGGIVAWGTRHWLPLVPLACLPLAEAYARLGRPRWKPAWIATVGILAVSLLIQLSAAVVDYRPYTDALAAERRLDILNEDEILARLVFEPGASPLLNQVRFLAPKYSDLSWLRVTQPGDTRAGDPEGAGSGEPVLDPVAAGAALLVGGSAALAFGLGQRRRLRRGWLPALTALSACGALVIAGRLSESSWPTGGDLGQAVRTVDREARPNAALITTGVAPLGTTFAWLKGGVDHIGLAERAPRDGLDPEAARALARAGGGHTEVWTLWPQGQGGAVAAAMAGAGPPTAERSFGSLVLRRYSFQ